ncbi:MAG: glycosyltransferase family 4 protein [Acidobacteriia bacterium]|nr:glycosyltransferase family 4 protein [Terriglobia bacterium]
MEIPERILLTTDTVGGVWTYAIELIRGLTRAGISVALATMGAPLNADQRRETAGIRDLHLFESAFRLEWMADPWDEIEQAGSWLLAIERQFQPQLVHLNQYCFGALPFQAPVVIAGHSCVLSWWQAVHGCEAPAEWSRYRDAVTRGLRAAALVVAPSEAMLDSLAYYYGPLGRRMSIPNGRELPALPAVPKEPFLFAAGRFWDEAKNLGALEQAAPELPWPIYVAGDVSHPDGAAGPCSHCRSLGRIDPRAMSEWMNRAAIYALPAKYEPFGLSILEAALAGCALILGDIPSLRENWRDAAVFVAPEDREGLLAAARAFINSPELRIEFAQRARARAQNFSIARMTGGYLEAYRTVLELRAPRALGHSFAGT